MFKRSRTAIVLIVVAFVTLSLGLSSVALAARGATVKMWAFPLHSEQDDMKNIFGPVLEEFAKMEPDIKVEINFFPWDARRERMLTAIAARVAPDAAYINDDMVAMFEGKLLSLEKYVSAKDLEDFKPGTIKGASYKGHLMFMPILMNTQAPFYNLDYLEKAGFSSQWANTPHTWDEFFEAARKIKAMGQWSYTSGIANAGVINDWDNWLYQAGGDYFSEDRTKSLFDSPEALEAMENYVYIWDNFVNPADRDKTTAEARDSFGQGRAAIYIGQNHFISSWKKDNPALASRLVYGYALKRKVAASEGTVAGYGVFAQTRNPEAAVKWVKQMTGPTGMFLLDTAVNFIAPRYSIDRKVSETINDAVFNRAIENSVWFRSLAVSPIGAAAFEEAKIAIQNAVLHKKTSREALLEAKNKIDKLLAEMR